METCIEDVRTLARQVPPPQPERMLPKQPAARQMLKTIDSLKASVKTSEAGMLSKLRRMRGTKADSRRAWKAVKKMLKTHNKSVRKLARVTKHYKRQFGSDIDATRPAPNPNEALLTRNKERQRLLETVSAEAETPSATSNVVAIVP